MMGCGRLGGMPTHIKAQVRPSQGGEEGDAAIQFPMLLRGAEASEQVRGGGAPPMLHRALRGFFEPYLCNLQVSFAPYHGMQKFARYKCSHVLLWLAGFDFSIRSTADPLPDKLKPLLGECWPAFELLRKHALKPMQADQIPR